MQNLADWPESGIEGSATARFEQQVAAHPDRLAVQADSASLTYRELDAAANRLAHCILARVGPGSQPIVLLLDHTPAIIVAILAVLKAGQFYSVLEPAMPEARLGPIVADAAAPLILTASHLRPLAERLAQQPPAAVLVVDELDPGLPAGSLGLPITPDHCLNLMYTSGTTGQPKGVLQNHRNLLRAVWGQHHHDRITPDDRFTALQPCSFGASAANLFGALLAGASLHLYDLRRQGISALPGWLREQRISIYHSVPTVYRRMLSAAGPDARFPELRLVKLGGEAITRRDTELFEAHFAETSALRIGLGSTEAYLPTHYVYRKGSQFEGNIAPVGSPSPGYQILIHDDDSQQVPQGQPGEIVVRSRFLSPGYWGKPDETAARFLPDPQEAGVRLMRTGDLGRWLPNGQLQHLGRMDSRIKVRGTWVDLDEVEAALLQSPQVREVAVVPQTHDSGETRLLAYYVPSAFPGSGGLRSEAAGRLPAHMVPDHFMPLESLPLLPFGKVDRRALPVVPAAVATPEGYRPPVTPSQVRLAAIWAVLLKRGLVGANDDFFELGGDSLVAVQLGLEVEKGFGLRLDLRDLFDSPRLEQLAGLIDARLAAGQAAAQPGAAPADLEADLRRLGFN